MDEYHERQTRGKIHNLKAEAARLFLASLLATGIGEANNYEANAQQGQSPLERYGRITLYNANAQEGGTIGQSNIVYDPVSKHALMCTIQHVALGGPLWRDAFDIEKSEGDDPIVCFVLGGNPDDYKDVPEISTQEINTGDIISMPSEGGGITDFIVTEVEENAVWFTPQNQDDWIPGSGDSGTLVGSIEGEDTLAVGVYAGQSIMPNRNSPNNPIVTYYMVPFENNDAPTVLTK